MTSNLWHPWCSRQSSSSSSYQDKSALVGMDSSRRHRSMKMGQIVEMYGWSVLIMCLRPIRSILAQASIFLQCCSCFSMWVVVELVESALSIEQNEKHPTATPLQVLCFAQWKRWIFKWHCLESIIAIILVRKQSMHQFTLRIPRMNNFKILSWGR